MKIAPARARARLATGVAGLGLLAGALLAGTAGPSVAVPGALSFPGEGFGAIPEGPGYCAQPGVLDVEFDVTGMPATALTHVAVDDLEIDHTYLGDLVVTLIAPDKTTSAVLFGRTGESGLESGPYDTSLSGSYSFADDAQESWWAAARSTNPVPPGAYRTSVIGGAEHAGDDTLLTEAFEGVADPNGTWTLRVTDRCEGEVGQVTGATLDLGDAHTFAGSGSGDIPDGYTEYECVPGEPLDVTFDVTGMPTTAPADVRVTGLSLTHTWVSDLTVTLIAPDGRSSRTLFGRTGVFEPGEGGDTSDLLGPYTFADDATSNWWVVAEATGDGSEVIPGDAYRTSETAGVGSPGANTSLTRAFSALATPNGRWILRFVDSCGGSDIGAVSAATLELTPGTRSCAALETAATAAQSKATSAGAALTSARTALESADRAVAKAKAAVVKAKTRLKAARKGGSPAQIKQAGKKLASAKKRLKAAQAARAAAYPQVTTAQTADTAARAELTAAQAALAACQRP